MTDRAARHRILAEAGIKEHQDMIAAHLAGQKPPVVRSFETGKPAVFFTPQSGEKLRERGMSWGGTEHALKELQMYWRRIPNFGVHEARIFTSEEGWVQVLYWSGTADDGTYLAAQEVDVITTDADFDIVRLEIHSDKAQWINIVTFLHGGKTPTASYDELMMGEPGSAA